MAYIYRFEKIGKIWIKLHIVSDIKYCHYYSMVNFVLFVSLDVMEIETYNFTHTRKMYNKKEFRPYF
jgi:hypothetical protein